jgi:hypothetical protein
MTAEGTVGAPTCYVVKRAKIVSLKFVYRFFSFWAQNLANNLTKPPIHVTIMGDFSTLYFTAVEPYIPWYVYTMYTVLPCKRALSTELQYMSFTICQFRRKRPSS